MFFKGIVLRKDGVSKIIPISRVLLKMRRWALFVKVSSSIVFRINLFSDQYRLRNLKLQYR
jgi:hypothetical protein